MKLRIMSDLHLEFMEFTVPPQEDDKNTVLILAGDTCVVHSSMLEKRFTPFLEGVSEQFAAIVVIAGNHEHYGGFFARTIPNLREAITKQGIDNVYVLDKESVTIDEVTFIGGTLWTDCDKSINFNMVNSLFARYMNDGRVIRAGGQGERAMLGTDTLREHNKTIEAFKVQIAQAKASGLKAIVVAHHGVTAKSIHPEYNGSILNMFFASELTPFWQEAKPDLIIHGHTHKRLDYDVDGTTIRVIVNPRGYVGPHGAENPYFDPDLTIDTNDL